MSNDSNVTGLSVRFFHQCAVVDLFATQAILPSLVRHYGVTPGAMGFAVNACTIGMAIAGLGVAYFSRHIDRRRGILISLVVLAVPTTLLASAPNLTVFTLLRGMQGLCMASVFTLTLAYLGENASAGDTASARRSRCRLGSLCIHGVCRRMPRRQGEGQCP